jgi:hypothetical protein
MEELRNNGVGCYFFQLMGIGGFANPVFFAFITAIFYLVPYLFPFLSP